MQRPGSNSMPFVPACVGSRGASRFNFDIVETGVTAEASLSKLRVLRPGQLYVDRLRSYKIYVDGTQVGAIGRKSVLDVDIASGDHVVEARIDWGRAKPLKINAAPGQVIEIEVTNHWGTLLALWAVTFGARSYLTLRQL